MEKKILFLVIIICISFNSSFGQTPITVDNVEIKKFGLVAELAFVKDISENTFLGRIESLRKDKDSIQKSEKLVAEYAYIKTLFDEFILQLEMDLFSENKPSLYEAINKKIQKNEIQKISSTRTKKTDVFIRALQQSYMAFQTYVGTNPPPPYKHVKHQYTFQIAGQDLISDAISLYGAVETGIKDGRDFRATKIGNINSLLEVLRLDSVGELLSNGNDIKSPGGKGN